MINLKSSNKLKSSDKRFKFFIFSLLTLLIFIPFFLFAKNNVKDGYQQLKNHGSDLVALFWNATTTPGVIATSTTGVCVYNSTSNDYFIPTRTWEEWSHFFVNKPAGLTLMQCVGDKACTLNGSGGYGGGETCSNAPEDCGACAVTCPPGFTDGRDYPDGQSSPYLAIVQVGSQCWLADNLKWIGTTSYGDGMIGVQRPTVYSSAYPRFYVNGYDTGVDEEAAAATSNYSDYGVLYNRPAALDFT